jgi:hypothetical protein
MTQTSGAAASVDVDEAYNARVLARTANGSLDPTLGREMIKMRGMYRQKQLQADAEAEAARLDAESKRYTADSRERTSQYKVDMSLLDRREERGLRLYFIDTTNKTKIDVTNLNNEALASRMREHDAMLVQMDTAGNLTKLAINDANKLVALERIQADVNINTANNRVRVEEGDKTRLNDKEIEQMKLY